MVENPLFDGINKDDLEAMLKCLGAYTKKYDKSNFIILEQDQVKSIGIVLKGSVAMLKEDILGEKAIVAVIKENEILGETFVCGSKTYVSTVSFQAMTKTEVLFLPFDKVLHSCKMSCIFHHRLIENMVELIANKNMQLINKVNIMSQKTLREKIESFLSDQAIRQGKTQFESPLGRVQMAEYLGVDRSALTRELNRMREEGIIEFERNRFVLKGI